MSRMLSKMNLISVVQQLPEEDIETIQGYVEMIEQENNVQKVMIENFVKENQELKSQIEELKLQNFNLREDIMIKKMSLPSKEIKDKTFFDLYDMPTYEELKKQLEESDFKIANLTMDKIKLKKQLEEYRMDIINGMPYIKLELVLNQQKEFIEYLENEIKSCELTIDLIFSHNKEMKIYQEILSKYKEIIGDKGE